MIVSLKNHRLRTPSFLVVSLLLVLAVFFIISKQVATAANPQLISFQGKVVNADGTNVTNGSYNFDFILWDDLTAGTNRWQELTKSVTVTNGVFQTYLGSATALPNFNTYPSLYLAVRFNADAAGYMSPRVQMASVPYALNSDTLAGISASTFVQLGASQSGNINIGSGTITSGAINSQTLSSSAVTFDSTAFSIDSTTSSNLTVTGSGQGLTISAVGGGAQELILSSAGTAASAINIDATAGGLTLDVLTSLSIDVTGATGASNISVVADADAEDLTIETTGSAGDLILNSADQITLNGASATSLILSDYITDANAVLYTTTAGVLTRVVETETGSQCLLSGAGASGIPVWGACSGGGTTLQGAYDAGETIAIDSGNGALIIDAASANFEIKSGEGADTGDIRFHDGTDNWLFVDESADTIAIGAAAGSGITLGGTGITTTNSGAFTVTQGFTANGLATFNTVADFTLAGTENVNVTSDLAGTVNVLNILGTPASGANTAYGLYIDQADSANTNAFDASLVIDNSDTNLAIADGILLVNAGGGFTRGITFAGATTDVTTTGSEDLTIAPGTTGTLTLTSLNTGTAAIQINSSGTGGDLDINVNDAITLDSASFSIDGTAASNLTVTGSGQSLTLSAAGGGAQELILNSAGTGASALNVDTTGTGGGMTFNTTDGAIVLTAAGATNGDVTISPTDDFNLNGTAGSLVNIGTSSVTQVITIGNATNTGLVLNDANWSVTDAGTATFADIVCNSASCISTGEITDATITGDDIATSIAGAGLVLTAGSPDTLDIASGNAGIVVNANDITLDATVAGDGLSSTVSSGSGLEVVAAQGLTLLLGCADTQVLAWDEPNDIWECATPSGGSGYSTIQEEGASVTQRSTLNFIGSAVTCIDNASKTECTITGGAGGDLLATYNAGSAGDQIITLDATQDSIVVRNPSSAGSDSTFTFKIEQLNTGISNVGLYVDNRGTGNTLQLDDVTGDTTPLIVDADGRLGIGTTTIIGSTERLLQVGSPTNRGNASVYGDIVSQGLSDITALTGIKDIFIYDTTTDSDGGRWIDWATTDKNSWYTEALDDGPSDPCVVASDDRCYKSSFPRKAILVVTTDSLYIFDAATNTMWMKFSQNATGYALGVDTNNDPTSVTAANGVIYVGAKGTATGSLYQLDFVNDRMWNIDSTDRSAADVGISGRNAAVVYNSDNNISFDLAKVGTAAEWANVNDVFAIVVRNSLTATAVGAATSTVAGQGNTYVGLATDSGLSVINMASGVVVQYSDVTADDYTAVALTSRGQMYALNTTQDQLERWNAFDTQKATLVNGAPTVIWDQLAQPALWPAQMDMTAGAPDALEVVERGSSADDNADLIYVGHSLGLSEIHDSTLIAIATQRFHGGWSKYYNTTKQTGLFTTDTKSALMLDETPGTIAEDASLNDNDWSYINTPTSVSGVRGKAVSFDNGTSQEYICSDADENATCDVDTTQNMLATGWTLSMWFKHTTTVGAVDVLFEKCVTAVPAQATGCVAAYMTATGTIAVGSDDDATWTRGSSYDTVAASTALYNDNQWHQLVISRTNAAAVNAFVDGNPLNMTITAAVTLTLDGSQIVTFGAGCATTVTANCAAAGTVNHWDGAIDDITWASGGTTTRGTLSAPQIRRLYSDARPLVGRKVINVTDATSASSTTLTDTGEAWIPNEFTGMIVEVVGGTGGAAACIGQSRRVTGNTTTQLTFTPALSGCTPDTSTDFDVDPEAIYGAAVPVLAVGVTKGAPLGEARQMCVGTNNGTDGGGVTCFNHQAGPNIVADIFHGASAQTDDASVEWTGTDYDDIRSIDLASRTMAIGSEAHSYLETSDVQLGQGLDYLANQVLRIKYEIQNDGITLAGSTAGEVGFTGGADLAENYTSIEGLVPGDVVALEPNSVGAVKRSTLRYQNDLIGVVSTAPGVILGPVTEGTYPIALSGRVPVNVTTENGAIKAGDRITSSSTPGYAMKAVNAGRVIGSALDDLTADKYTDCPEGIVEGVVCGQVTIFVNLVDYSGESVDIAINDAENSGMLWEGSFLGSLEGIAGLEAGVSELQTTARQAQLEKADKILRYLAGRQTAAEGESEILAEQISATELNAASVYAGDIFASSLTVDKIRANQIDGLEIFTDQIKSLSEKLAAEQAAGAPADEGTGEAPSDQTSNSVSEEPIITDIDMSNVTFQTATVSLDLNVMGTLTANGALVVNGDATFNSLVEFAERATFNNDTGGFAVIHTNQQEVEVKFTKPYDISPSVSLAVKNGKFVSYSYEEVKEEQETSPNFGKVIGIKILLEEPADFDVEFSWTALSIKEAKTSELPL